MLAAKDTRKEIMISMPSPPFRCRIGAQCSIYMMILYSRIFDKFLLKTAKNTRTPLAIIGKMFYYNNDLLSVSR